MKVYVGDFDDFEISTGPEEGLVEIDTDLLAVPGSTWSVRESRFIEPQGQCGYGEVREMILRVEVNGIIALYTKDNAERQDAWPNRQWFGPLEFLRQGGLEMADPPDTMLAAQKVADKKKRAQELASTQQSIVGLRKKLAHLEAREAELRD